MRGRGPNFVWRICARFYQARANRAKRLHSTYQKKAEKFFLRVKGIWE